MQRSEKIAIGIMVIILVLTLGFFSFVMPSLNAGVENPQPMHLPYEKYFNPDNVTRVDIIIDDTLFQKMLDTVPDKYVSCTVALNGDVYKNVGIKIKGQLSRTSVENSSTSERFGFKIDASSFVSQQLIAGLDCFVLNPELFDATVMREFLAYEMLTEAGVKTPLYSFAAVYVNNEYWGLYVMAESVDKSFIKRNYGVLNGNLYRPEGTRYILSADNFEIGPDLSTNHRGGHLEYAGEDWKVYDEIFSHPVFLSRQSEGIETIMEIVRCLHEKRDPSSKLNIDEILAYFAVNAAISNFDCYFNQVETHNYFFYENDGKLTIIPWDLDNAFAPPYFSSSQAVNFPVDEPVSAVWGKISLDRLPLMEYVVSTPEIKEKYYQNLRSVAQNQMGEHLLQRIDEVSEMISPYAASDPHASYQPDIYYTKAVSALKKYVMLRTQNVLDQIDGKIPATGAGQAAHPELLTDVGDFETNDMGSELLWISLWP